MHVDAAAGEYRPEEQETHPAFAELEAYVPARHAAHTVEEELAATAEYFPPSQLEHEEAPVLTW